MGSADFGFGDLGDDRVLQAHHEAQQADNRRQEPVPFQVGAQQAET
jgi:hypothetical protein